MDELLTDLLAHQAWADAEHWRALEALPAALADDAVRHRLVHIHVVQNAFVALVSGETPRRRHLTDFDGAAALKRYARTGHEAAASFIAGVRTERLGEAIAVPWIKDPPAVVTVRQALTQAVMHSQYHRGQNAARMRRLGGEPPLTDLVVWYARGRPEPRWE